MTNCEICGKDATLFAATIEGVDVEVCKDCARFGVVRQAPIPSRVGGSRGQVIGRREREHLSEPIPFIVSDYALRIKRRREHIGLTQAELAKKLAERESVISALESGTMEPSVALAQKIERTLSIKLIAAQDQDKSAIVIHQKSEGMTLGDLMKKK